ncbi:LLM class F420-dependent oxidoreductase [Streptomyces sp. NPDC023327]|uniref:LLM class F420-dependent oxidoreductase n=1 Tax=Streptomyces sp. NPDC023327 TaxID=3157088 RepID=UPI0033F8FD17
MQVSATLLMTDQTVGPADLAHDLEEYGFSALYLSEHTHIPASGATPYPLGGPCPEPYSRLLDPFVALTAAATVTEQLRLGTAICLVAQHDPIILAKQIATLDLLSNQRFTLGIGFGWNREEAADHGVDFADRREVARDHVAVMRALWASEPVGHQGIFARVQPSRCHPKPTRPGGPRILVGGQGAATTRLFQHICSYGDGWLAPVLDTSVFENALVRLKTQWRAAGRDPADLFVVPFLPSPHLAPGPRPGLPEAERFAELGITEIIVQLPSAGRGEVRKDMDEYAPLLAQQS